MTIRGQIEATFFEQVQFPAFLGGFVGHQTVLVLG